MRICCISDTHTLHGKLTIPECDILIHSGDACGAGSIAELANFANWFSAQKAKHKVYVPGNHDRAMEYARDIGRRMFHNVHVLVNDGCQVEGLNIWGTPHTPEFCNWAFQGDDGNTPHYPSLQRIYGNIPANTDILVSHGPPRNLLDRTGDGIRVGSRVMADRILSLNLKLYVCGHIHESYGVLPLPSGGTLVNAALADDYSDKLKEPILVLL